MKIDALLVKYRGGEVEEKRVGADGNWCIEKVRTWPVLDICSIGKGDTV